MSKKGHFLTIKRLKNYALQGLNFEKFGQIEDDLAKIEAKMFFLHRHLFFWAYNGYLVAFV